MIRFRLLLVAAAITAAGALSASALPTDAGRLAGIQADQSSLVIDARSNRSSARCFNRCMKGKRRSCRPAESRAECCSAACNRRRR
jgi:hypothetical protein